MTDRAGSFRRLSEAEALRALYIDFEGEKGKLPVLLGVHRRGQGARPYVHVHILDAAFAGPTESAVSLRASIENVVTRAERGERRIVSWSEHDLRVVRTLAEKAPDLVARFEARYANALGVAEWWRNKLHGGDKPDPGHLADYLALIGYEVPGEAVGGDVGEVIRDIRSRRERGLEPTVGQRERWARLIEHNRHDCVGMRRVCLLATREIAATDFGRKRPSSSVTRPKGETKEQILVIEQNRPALADEIARVLTAVRSPMRVAMLTHLLRASPGPKTQQLIADHRLTDLPSGAISGAKWRDDADLVEATCASDPRFELADTRIVQLARHHS